VLGLVKNSPAEGSLLKIIDKACQPANATNFQRPAIQTLVTQLTIGKILAPHLSILVSSTPDWLTLSDTGIYCQNFYSISICRLVGKSQGV